MPSPITPIITTDDPEGLVRFYSAVVGATEVMRHPEEGEVFYLGLEVGGAELGIVNEPPASGAQTRIVLSFEVPDVDAARDRVESAGGTVGAPPQDMPWGQRVAHVNDSDGNELNLTATS